jgi:ABC-type bacteriocin/lantibiotic exporter with double-glycine peptidase domain
LAVNKYNFTKFAVVRICLMSHEFIVPYIMIRVLEWVQSGVEEPLADSLQMIALGLSIPAIQIVCHLIWEFFCFQMIEVGHRTHTALKVMLFRKNMKMTAATNKDFSSGEISGIIMGESNKIWDFIWSGPEYLECPLVLGLAFYCIFQEIGWCCLIVVAFTLTQMFYGYLRGKSGQKVNEEQREKHEKRMLHINESFNNIKSVKLYGWETKFLKTIESIYQEELAIGDKQLLLNKVHDVVRGCLHHLMPVVIFSVYMALGNTLTLSKMAIAGIMVNRIRDRIHQSKGLYDRYFEVRDSMEKLWRYYTAPEAQKGLITRADFSTAAEHAMTIQGTFSWSVTPKLDQADKDKIKEKLKKKAYEKRTKDMGKARKALFDMMPDKKEEIVIPLKDRTLN